MTDKELLSKCLTVLNCREDIGSPLLSKEVYELAVEHLISLIEIQLKD